MPRPPRDEEEEKGGEGRRGVKRGEWRDQSRKNKWKTERRQARRRRIRGERASERASGRGTEEFLGTDSRSAEGRHFKRQEFTWTRKTCGKGQKKEREVSQLAELGARYNPRSLTTWSSPRWRPPHSWSRRSRGTACPSKRSARQG